MIRGFRHFHADSLRRNLLWWVLGPMVIVLLFNIALIYKLGHQSADRRIDRYLTDASTILLDQLRTRQGQVEFNLHSGALSILTVDKNDQVYYSLSGQAQAFHFGSSGLPLPSVKLSETPVYYLANYAGHRIRIRAAIMPEVDVESGYVVVLVGKTLVLHEERAQEWMWRILPSMIFSLSFAGFMVWLGVNRSLRPLLQLRNEVVSRSSRDLSPLQEEQVVSEIRPLIHSFNELMGRLDASFMLKRRFIADASHQLRTPLTGLKAQAELALALEDPEQIRHSLQQICKAADHATHLVNQLLLLARSEPGGQKNLSELDLQGVAKNITESWVVQALQKKIDLGFECCGTECYLTGNELLLGEMLNNLIDNALRYTPSGGHVTVRIRCITDAVILEVEDNGPGVPEADRERVFERFYRVLGSNQDGCGLGLAIVQEIAHYHHASVSLSSGEAGIGTLISIAFRATRHSWKN